MNNGFTDLRDIAALDLFLAQSADVPVVIFKHSETCGISDRAYTEMLKLVAQRAKAASGSLVARVPIGIVAVQAARHVSNEIESRTGIAHESPQVFVMLGGKVTWSASHGRVRAEAVEQALIEAAGTKQ